MADRRIEDLPYVGSISDSSMLPVEDGGIAYHTTGQVWKEYLHDALADDIAAAEAAKNEAELSASIASNAANSATSASSAAVAAKTALDNLVVTSETLAAGADASVVKSTSGGVTTFAFGIPRGATGSQGVQGPAGPQGVQGPQGPAGGNSASIEAASGLFYFSISPQGHLLMTYSGSETNPNAWFVDRVASSPTYGHLFYDPDAE